MELFGKLERQELDKAILVHIDFNREDNRENLAEFYELVESAGAQIMHLITTKRENPDAKYFIGSGKAQEIAEAVELYEADIVIVNHALSPSQERNLERLVQARVLDRVGLILDIFAQRARSHEGKLQVELAQLRHMSTRLVRGWTHLERQAGGIGLRGPGETQLETDRRLIGERMKQIQKRIEKVRGQRQIGRRTRKKSDVPTVAIVGYTNAGKSTLFNALTNADVYAEDRLFATLDATLRGLHLPGAGQIILVDTVGFIRHLPHDLVAAFRSTLEETQEASLLIHLVDAADEARGDKIFEVQEVLREVGADEVPQLEVFNKIDLFEPPLPAKLDYDDEGLPNRVWLSALSGDGFDLLLEALAAHFKGEFVRCLLTFGAAEGKLRASLYELGKVENEELSDDGKITLQMYLTQAQWKKALGLKNLIAKKI